MQTLSPPPPPTRIDLFLPSCSPLEQMKTPQNWGARCPCSKIQTTHQNWGLGFYGLRNNSWYNIPHLHQNWDLRLSGLGTNIGKNPFPLQLNLGFLDLGTKSPSKLGFGLLWTLEQKLEQPPPHPSYWDLGFFALRDKS